MPMRPEARTLRNAGVAAALALAVLLLAWPRLLLGGLIPIDGNLLAVAYPNWAVLHALGHEPRLALWNPLRALGFPQLADPITMTLYPPSWPLAAAGNFPDWLRLWVVGHTLLAAGFAGALAWRRQRRRQAVVAAMLLAGLNGFFMARVTMPHQFASAAWLPAAWYFAETGSALGLGAAWAGQWLAGYPPFSMLTVLSAVLLAWPRPAAARRCAAAAAWALGLSAVQLIPFIALLLRSTRGLRLDAAQAARFSLPPLQLLKELLPQWPAWRPQLAGDPAMVTFYVGGIGLALAVWGWRRGGPRERRLAALAAAALILSLGGHLPGFRRLIFLHGFRYPANWLLLAAAAAAPLAAAGVGALRPSLRWPAVLLLAADLIVFAWQPKSAWSRPEILDAPVPLELLSRDVPLPRIYHTERLMGAWAAGSLENEEDYLLMKDFLAPSYGTAFSVGELLNFQTLRLAVGERYRALAAREPAALDWAGANFIVDLAAGAGRARHRDISVRRNPSALPRVFLARAGLPERRADRLPAFVYRPGLVRVRLDTDRPATLVLAELDFPGWRVLIDGAPVARERFAGAFVSAPVPPGRHEALFLFRPWFFLAGLGVSLAAVWLAWSRLRSASANA
ncbi:MAG: hypothetical protein PHF00_09800 [Elusimicrobia bacterium]|nr:hypothetical protein [Elusimicrobiota bacterium]